MRSKIKENMGEIKSVKVDNWGVFFLQKLQNFFNKTDYCDLTLQFNDNSQLKVHRLVLNACTDYFNVLEQTCEMVDDVLIMPNELQADLVVPIVNFMYTGTLEFELKIYGKLLKTARDMNMTVLLKLLEAHRRTMETKTKIQKTSPKQASFAPMKTSLPSNNKSASPKNPNRPIIGNSDSIYKSLQIKSFSSGNFKSGSTTSKPQSKTLAVKGPTRFECETNDVFDSTFDNISYESKPLKEEYEEEYNRSESSPFEQLRQTGFSNNKRPAQSILESPPAKKPNIEDVKEYAEQQRMRKQIAEEYGEEPEFDSILDDEFHNNDDDEEFISLQESTRPITSKSIKNQKPVKQQPNSRKTNDSSSQSKPTIVVKECSSSNVDHAKIISEVLRKYPHLIKNNKNIKLKIMPTTSGSGTQKVVIKKDSDEQRVSTSTLKTEAGSPKKIIQTVSTTSAKSEKLSSSGTKVAQTTTQKPTALSTPNQPRRIDSKTMKQLIALGAENTTGPWLCLRCGVNGRPISIPSYRGFRRHLVNTHKEKIDPRLCEHCGWRSINQKELAFHMYTQHDVRTSISFPKCEHCGTVVFDLQALDQHIDDVHPEVKEDNQQCIYCNKTFSTELMLYNHMKDQHKERARDDGVIDFSEEDEAYEEYEQKIQGTGDVKSGSKIKILSDIDLPKCISLTQITKPEVNTEFEREDIVEMFGENSEIIQPSDIITSVSVPISTEPKFINADGNVMELTPAQRAEIMSQLEQGGDGVVMVLDESFSENTTSKILRSVDDEASQDSQTTVEQESDSNILEANNNAEDTANSAEDQLMEEENHPDSNEDKNTISEDMSEDLEEQLNAWKPIETEMKKCEQKEDIKKKNEEEETSESLDEQLEKLTQMRYPETETKSSEKVSRDELDEKLKILTNDWTDDEEENEIQKNEKSVDINIQKENFEFGKQIKNKIVVESNNTQNDNSNDTENIEDILEGGDNEKIEKLKDELVESKSLETNEKEIIQKEDKLSEETSQKDLDTTEESLAQQDSGNSDDEEALREQPICSTEEDGLVDSNVPVPPETGKKEEEEEINKEDKKLTIITEKKVDSRKEEKLDNVETKEENDINITPTIHGEIVEKSECSLSDVEVKEEIKASESEKNDAINEKSPSKDTKEDIKSIIHEWDEENDNDL